VPIGRAPAAPVGVGAVAVKDEPAAFHFGHAQFGAAGAGHLVGRQWQVHVFGRVAIGVIDAQRAFAARKAAGGIGV